jgi:hypothetical protein
LRRLLNLVRSAAPSSPTHEKAGVVQILHFDLHTTQRFAHEVRHDFAFALSEDFEPNVRKGVQGFQFSRQWAILGD